MGDYPARTSVVIVSCRHALQLESDRPIRPPTSVSHERVGLLRDVQSERRGIAPGCIRETGGNSVLIRGCAPTVRDHEWTIDDFQRAHVEHVTASCRAGQTVIDEIEVGLPDLIRMRG